jgi:hypothetical protein
MVLWRDPKSREQQGLTVATLVEAETLKRLLDANGQSFEIASMPSCPRARGIATLRGLDS